MRLATVSRVSRLRYDGRLRPRLRRLRRLRWLRPWLRRLCAALGLTPAERDRAGWRGWAGLCCSHAPIPLWAQTAAGAAACTAAVRRKRSLTPFRAHASKGKAPDRTPPLCVCRRRLRWLGRLRPWRRLGWLRWLHEPLVVKMYPSAKTRQAWLRTSTQLRTQDEHREVRSFFGRARAP